MKISVACLLIFMGCLMGCVHAQPPQPMDSNEQPQTYARQSLTTFAGNYLVYLPDGYGEQSTRNWPVIIYLHSADARGDDLGSNDVALKQEGLPQVLRSGMKLPFIL